MNLRKKVLQKAMPKHVGIILDGNGRWAKKRGLNRESGHKQGALNLKNITLEANALGVEVLSVYAFSTENWKRPQTEVDALMKLPKAFESQYHDTFKSEDVRIMFSGRRDRLSSENLEMMRRVEEETKLRKGVLLNICIDYGSQDEIIQAAHAMAKDYAKGKLADEAFNKETFEDYMYTRHLPPVDLLIRTSGEQRLSNFLLWQVAYAEFYFTSVHWPAFKARQFHKAIHNFQKRCRKFGGLKG